MFKCQVVLHFFQGYSIPVKLTQHPIYNAFLLLLCLATRYSIAEVENVEYGWLHEKSILLRTDAESCAQNFAHLFSSPFHTDIRSYGIAGAFLCMTALSFTADRSVQHEMRENASENYDNAIQPWQYYGVGYFPLAISAVGYISGLVFSNNWLRETGRECLMSLACATLITTSLKIAVGRERPYANEGSVDFDPFSFHNENFSFPSGHTATAFAFSTVLASRIKNPFISIALYTVAGMTALQRVYSDNHWFSDVFMGVLIGTSSGLFIVHDSNRMEKTSVHIVPLFSKFGTGICMSRNF